MMDPPLRLRYEEAVLALRVRVAAMRDNGVSTETIRARSMPSADG